MARVWQGDHDHNHYNNNPYSTVHPTQASQSEQWYGSAVWRKQCGQPGTEAGGGDSGRVAGPLSTPHTHLHPV